MCEIQSDSPWIQRDNFAFFSILEGKERSIMRSTIELWEDTSLEEIIIIEGNGLNDEKIDSKRLFNPLSHPTVLYSKWFV